MIARFSRRSIYTFCIKNKSTPEEYKILSLCELGYTYTFLFMSRIKSSNVDTIANVNKTNTEVFYLVKQLSSQKSFNIYMNNYFTNINLFSYFQKKGFEACGTVRVNIAKFPVVLKKEKEKQHEWDFLISAVVEEVLALLWIDNRLVIMLSTIHTIEGEKSKVHREYRKSRETSSNSQKVRSIFENTTRKTLLIPKMIDNYNHHMGDVNIANQLCNYYSTQLIVQRTWSPLFFWLLDTVIVNSYIISKKLEII